MKPLAAANSSPRWRGLSASRLSISFKAKGMASPTSSGSSSEAKVVPLEASASPSRLTANRFTEHPIVAASKAASKNSRITRTCDHYRRFPALPQGVAACGCGTLRDSFASFDVHLYRLLI